MKIAGTKIAAVFAAVLALASCVVEAPDDESVSSSSSSGSSSASSTATGASFSPAAYVYINLSDKTASEDNASWSAITEDGVLFLDESVEVSLVDSVLIKVDAEDITKKVGVSLSGSLTTGGVKIQTSTAYETGLYLNNVTIASSNYPCVDMTKGGAVSVFLTGTNAFTDGRKYGYGYGDSASTCDSSRIGGAAGSDSKGTLYCKGGLAICEGSEGGSLSITQAYKNCIASKDGYLSVQSGTLSLKNYTSTSNTGKNGLFGGQGIEVSGGTISFDGYGIISTSDVRKANGFKTDDDDYPSSYVKISGGTTSVATYNGKGINAPVVEISGGTNTFAVTGTMSYAERTSSGSWYNADGEKESGTVKFAPEGIEGASSVTFSGGTTIVSAPDDGVNVSNTGGTLTISGGTLYVRAQGDGIDSNGNIVISGGVAVISQTGGGNSPIDCGDNSYTFTVTGTDALVFAMGSSDMFSESIPSSAASAYICSTFSGSSTSSLAVNGVIALQSPQSYQEAILISSSFTSGSSYSYVQGGTISGTEYVSGTGIYLNPSVSGGTSVTATATTASGGGSGGGGSGGGGSGGGGGGPSGGGGGPGR